MFALVKTFAAEIDGRSCLYGGIATALLAGLIAVGSRFFSDFDSALIGYTFASLFATFGIVYRYSVWLTKPSTRRYWNRGFAIFFKARYWRNGWIPMLFAQAVFSRLIAQDFILKRGLWRYIAHFLICWGCLLAAAVTFPLVFGWIHFEQGAISPDPTYRVVFFGQTVQELPLEGIQSWLIFHALVISSFMVIPGVMMAMYRRINDRGATAVQGFTRDLLPLIMLFLVAFSGLLLWINYEWMEGYYYSPLAQFHAICVIGTLLYLPFGKLFHVFQRPASLGIALYREIMRRERKARCPLTQEEFAPAAQLEDFKTVLPELGFDYRSEDGQSRWQEFAPRSKRMIIGRVHSKLRNGKFS